ncbi:hypothetical protein AJ79_08227 [Helicocarpus griseus UAMH5409]|uniref:Extracellular membrane protein CFEM domain-containing protein n=1 Tax=Helicocarpus griseus UAMH5409 TaxID=1447875 RepID=A0A2B7WUN3_9EURO|nr:hypothetical protein AJ79_08227 [Helicocarpus griseus UAMH5409]
MPRRRQPQLASLLLLAVAGAIPNSLCQAEETWPRSKDPSTEDDMVPRCAQGCLFAFIQDNFPPITCPDPRNLSCLCTKESATGFTLGEAGLRCVYSSCIKPKDSDFKIYGVCSGFKGAIPNTHSVITATATAMATPGAGPTTSLGNSLTISAPSTSAQSSSTISTTSSPSQTSRPTTILPRTSTSAQPTTLPSETAAAANKSVLNSGQVLAFAIVSTIATTLILGLILFYLVKRRRKKKLESKNGSEFEIGGEMSEPPPSDSPTGYRGDAPLKTPVGRYNEPVGRQLSPRTFDAQQQFAAGMLHPAYKVNNGDNASLSTSNTAKSLSFRTISQLLPDKPNYEFPPPRHPIAGHLGHRPISAATEFEEDHDDRKGLLSGDDYRAEQSEPQSHSGYITSKNSYSRRRTYIPQYLSHQNSFTQQQKEQQQPARLKLTTPANESDNQPPKSITASPPTPAYELKAYERMGLGSSIRPIRPPPSGHSSLSSQDRVSRSRDFERQSSHSKLRTSATSLTSFESIESDDCRNASGNAIIVGAPKCTTLRLSPVREGQSGSPGFVADPDLMIEPLRYPSRALRSVYKTTNNNDNEQGEQRGVADTSTNNRHAQPPPRPYPYGLPTFPKFHQPLRPPRPPPKPLSASTQHQDNPYITPPLTINESRSSSSGTSRNSSLLSKRRGEIVADRMENGLDISKARVVRRHSPLLIVEKQKLSGGGEGGAMVRGALKTPSPSYQRQSRQARQRRSSDGFLDAGLQEAKLTPTKRGSDLVLNVG